MSIASEITRISGNVADAYTAANAKGATMPVTQNSDNLATTISTIQTGTTPTGTKSITSNGTHNVADYEYADVQVPTTAPTYYIEKTKDANGVAQNGSYLMDFSTFTDIGASVFNGIYNSNTNITGTVDMSGLTDISGNNACTNMFYGCIGLTSADFSSLKKINGNNSCYQMFYGCTGLTSIDLSSLETIDGTNSCWQMFYGCTGLTSLDLSSLKIVITGASNTFDSCSGITTVDLSSLFSIAQSGCQYMFQNCTSLASVDLSSLTAVNGNNGCNYMFKGCTSLTNIDLSSLVKAYHYSSGTCQYMFQNCTNLSTVNISRLTKLGPSALTQAFRSCTSLTELRFSGLAYTATNINTAFSNTLQGVTGCTVHFPSDWATDMASYSNITNGLGGTNTTVLFDLPAVTTLDLSHITTMPDGSFYGFSSSNYFPNITSVNLSNLTDVTTRQCFYEMFTNCVNLTSADLSSLTTIDADSGTRSMFKGCTGLTTVNLSSLRIINQQTACYEMFKGCTALTTIDLNSLTEIRNAASVCNYMFQGCTNLSSVGLASLTTINAFQALGHAFDGCTSLTELRFPSLKTVKNDSVFQGMLANTTGVTVHFPSNLSSYNFDCGGTNTTVLYDLPATA